MLLLCQGPVAGGEGVSLHISAAASCLVPSAYLRLSYTRVVTFHR